MRERERRETNSGMLDLTGISFPTGENAPELAFAGDTLSFLSGLKAPKKDSLALGCSATPQRGPEKERGRSGNAPTQDPSGGDTSWFDTFKPGRALAGVALFAVGLGSLLSALHNSTYLGPINVIGGWGALVAAGVLFWRSRGGRSQGE